MKFLCDRCKTRYSIGDDRVRGKILKIRCKNCANVITVREGMTDADAADPGPRRNRTTTAAPAQLASEPAPPNALGAAFAGAMTTKPPAALEEEWYVSIDGEQEGPFSLADAQRWVAAKPFDADLHCWSEGFDDWLPVDKVSHFRGLRKKPASPALPPAIPRAIPSIGSGGSAAARLAAQPAPQARPVEDDPKPLFAATMASLERSMPTASNPGLQLPALSNGAARATPPGGQPALPRAVTPAPAAPLASKPANGSALKPASHTTPAAPLAAIAPAPIAPAPITPAPIAPAAPSAPLAAKSSTSQPTRASTAVGVGGVAAKNAFDVGEQATQIEAPAFEPPAKAANAPVSAPDHDEDDDLQIGEVSRVVNLADLMATKPKRAESIPGATRASGAIAPLNRTGSMPRIAQTGAVARIGATGAVARIDDPALAAAAGADPAAAEAPSEAIAPAVQAHHRRGLFILIGVATLLLAGVLVAVLTMVGGDADITTLGRSDSIDTTRPDDPLRPRTGPAETPQTGSATNPFFPPKNPGTRPRPPTPNTNTNPIDPPQPGGDRLGGEDVEAMARSQSSTTQRCYMRAQRGADAILIGDVKKINVTIDVAPDGSIRTVDLSAHADNTLGKCLISAIKGWKFRPSPGGTYKFALVFSAG